ncbi:MAG TPA: AAA family ATPase [Chitinophagaceae bacterium]|nr:AAA family ATPase [Chitinophagaceae bacterium]
MLKKIVVLGPESTGKSTLCEQLASHYNTMWCPEYAREYLLNYGNKYTYEDLLVIAKGQIQSEENYARIAEDRLKQEFHERDTEAGTEPETRNPKLLFIDTDMHVMKVWSEFVYGKCHQFILDQLANRKYDLFLLCNIDLPWVQDELREYPDLKTRQILYGIYKELMMGQSVPWTEISGDYGNRLTKAIETIEALITE